VSGRTGGCLCSVPRAKFGLSRSRLLIPSRSEEYLLNLL